LAEGNGYRLINLPGAPFQTKFPLLYPAVLALIWRLWPAFPHNLLAMQGLSVVLGGAVVGLGYLYAIRVQRCRRAVAGLALAICALSPSFSYFSTQTLSEIPFALCLLATLWTVGRELDSQDISSPQRQGAVGLMIALPFLVRLIGLAIVVPAVWSLWRRKRHLTWYLAGAALPLIGWLAWIWAARHNAAPMRIALNNPDSWDWLGQVVLYAARRVAPYNAWMLMVAPAEMFPSSWKTRLPTAFVILGIVTWIFAIRRGRSALKPVLLTYASILVVWPWPPARFLLPLWPVLAPLALESVHELFGVVAVCVFAALALGGNLVALDQMAWRNHATHYPTLLINEPPPSWSSFERAFAWAGAHTKAGDVLIGGMDSMQFLYTGRPSIRPFDTDPVALFYGGPLSPVGTAEELGALLTRSNAKYFVQTAMPMFAEATPFAALVSRFRRQHPGCLSLVYEDELDSRFAIFSIEASSCRDAEGDAIETTAPSFHAAVGSVPPRDKAGPGRSSAVSNR
jgi:hypothetical protein